ncbi:Golgi resident protein GCP60-like [Babylonia areolata]|uniref:Golgi resident protein GCP60-like n=1 Tax=Babylonia areolata TaxID=304850 RepID=UPI003FD4DBAD
MAAAEALANDVNKLRVTDTLSTNEEKNNSFIRQWGFSLDDLYKIALRFFKEKEGKALQLTYNDKLRLVAYTKQVAHGKFSDEVQPDVGFLDVVGSDRSEEDPLEGQAWQALGDMPKETAMTEFIQYLDAKSSMFKSHVQDKKAEQEKMKRREKKSEAVRKKEEEEKKQRLEEEEALRQAEIEKQRQHDQEMQIRAALNQQTSKQFQQYVFEQYPYNPQLQDALIEHLQDQYYQQYMQQSYQQQVEHQKQQCQQLQRMHKEKQLAVLGATNTFAMPITNGVNDSGDSATGQEGEGGADEAAQSVLDAELPPMPEIVPASMWTRKDTKDFKNSLRKSKENMITVSSLATATVRVPTHKDGTTLFWEFATDYYDIGFGVYFEWTVTPGDTVTVHVSESSDDEEDYEDEEPVAPKGDDIEKGGKTGSSNKPPTDEIIPVYRRDCHEEVFCGSHVYPGHGVYLLKFDNSYSLWRSKTLYYRVYYSK